MLLYARATGGWYLKPCLFLLDSESGEWICAPLLRVWYLNFRLQKKKKSSNRLLLLQRFWPVWIRLEQKAGEGLANPIHKYIVPVYISGTRPFSKVKLLKPKTSFSFFLSLSSTLFVFAGWNCRFEGTETDLLWLWTPVKCSFLVKMLRHSCHDAGVRWEAVPASTLLPVLILKYSLGGSQVIIGEKGVCSSDSFLQTQVVNKRKFFPSVFFDFHASASTFLWWELFGICLSWRLSPGSRLFVFWATHWTALLFPHQVLQPSTGQQMSSHPQKPAWLPLVGGWQSAGDNGAVLVSLCHSQGELSPGQLLPHMSPGTSTARTLQKRQDYPATSLS